MSRLRFAALVVAASALSACQDPAGVGLGLIDDEGADPSAQSVFVTSLDTVAARTPAIGSADPSTSGHQPRVLVGDVSDPLYGDVKAIAYVDVARSTASSPEADEITEVWLELRRDYVYGDTTTVLPVALRQIAPTPTWSASLSYPADTTFTTGDVLATTTVSIAPADTLVRFDLPEAWVRANAETLVADDFLTAFEGFSIEATDGASAPGAVFGFSTLATDGSFLRVATDEDTLGYALQEVFSSIQHDGDLTPPPSILPAQSYANGGARFDVDFAAVGALPLARASLALPIDRSVAIDGPFVRPVATRAGVYAIREEDDVRAFLGDVVIGESGDGLTPNTSGLTAAIQDVLLGEATFDRFEIVPSISGASPAIPASLDILPIVVPAGPEAGPRFTLTVIGRPTT